MQTIFELFALFFLSGALTRRLPSDGCVIARSNEALGIQMCEPCIGFEEHPADKEQISATRTFDRDKYDSSIQQGG